MAAVVPGAPNGERGIATTRVLIGPIVRLQVQLSSLKVGEAPRRRYDPGPIRAVPSLTLDGRGVVAADVGDPTGAVLDIHHPAHPASRNRGGRNGVSVGLTAHYAAMRARFGEHLPDGVAGENILVGTEAMVGEDDLAGGLVIETAGGLVDLTEVVVAAPCVEFGRFVLRFPDELRPDRRVTEAVRFLDDGRRGYYAGHAGPPATVRLGDRVHVEVPDTDPENAGG